MIFTVGSDLPGPRQERPRGNKWLPQQVLAELLGPLIARSSLFCSWVIIGFTVVIIVVVFDPLGGKVVRYSSAGPTLAFNPEASQFVGGLKTAATSVWEKRMKLLCCCVERDDQAHMAFSSTAELFSTYFSVSRRLGPASGEPVLLALRRVLCTWAPHPRTHINGHWR